MFWASFALIVPFLGCLVTAMKPRAPIEFVEISERELRMYARSAVRLSSLVRKQSCSPATAHSNAAY